MRVRGEIVCKVSEILKRDYPDLGTIVSTGDIAVILSVFLLIQVEADYYKCYKTDQKQPIGEPNNKEIPEDENPARFGGDAAVERCPTEGFD